MRWEGHFDEHVCAEMRVFHFGTDVERHLQTPRAGLFDGGEDPEGGAVLPRKTVIDHDEFPIGREEGEGPAVLEFGEVDAIVKGYIVEHDRAVIARLARSGRFDDEVLVERQPQLRIARQVGFHLNAPINGAIHHMAIVGEDDIEPLQDVHEDLILLVLVDGFALGVDPANDGFVHSIRTGSFGVDHFARVGHGLHDDGLVVHEGLERFRPRELRVAVVDHLVEEFVEQDEVFANGLLGQGAAVVLEHLGDAGEELDDGARRHVGARRTGEDEAVAVDVEVALPVGHAKHRRGVLLHVAAEAVAVGGLGLVLVFVKGLGFLRCRRPRVEIVPDAAAAAFLPALHAVPEFDLAKERLGVTSLVGADLGSCAVHFG